MKTIEEISQEMDELKTDLKRSETEVIGIIEELNKLQEEVHKILVKIGEKDA